ncbi:hypothetical protein C8R43DRAFT_165558 [Mycena crocata]|nr:hypothetical protein C8R43DRAFT_165558 [Mycena crocata]
MPSSSNDAYLYHVMRHTDESYGGGETEIRGTYMTLEEANAAARVDLTKEWDLDFFNTYEVEEEEGMVSVTAECPEGETMSVYIDKKAAPNVVGSSKEKKSARSKPPRELKEVWIIMQTDFEHHTDEEGRSDLASGSAYESLQDANQAAREALFEACGVEDDEELGSIELREENRDSTTKGYVGYATVFEDDRHEIKVDVRNLSVQHASDATRKRRASSSETTGKKRKIEAEDVIDITSD